MPDISRNPEMTLSQNCCCIVNAQTGSHGTGFLATIEHGLWLISAMHVPLAAQPHLRWKEWPQKITCGLGRLGVPQKIIRLIDGSSIQPKFRYATTRDTGAPADFMAYPLSENFLPTGLSNRLRVFDLDCNHYKNPAVGEQIYVHGYPAPHGHLTCTEHRVHQLPTSQSTLWTEKEIVGGNSGGPVLNVAGELIGMAIGSKKDGPSTDRGTIVSRSTLLDAFRLSCRPQ